MKDNLFSVITTIQSPTASVRELVSRLNTNTAKLIVVGDQKGPPSFDLQNVEFHSLQDQLSLGLELARKLPTGHYTRKNLGYLIAIQRRAACIYETDDDNAPLESWTWRQEVVPALTVAGAYWVNIYRFFAEKKIWPRGFPLDAVQESFQCELSLSPEAINQRAPIQQGLANNSPDVDAIWRLVQDEPFDFRPGPSIYLPPGVWCPFNSQSTWWFPAAYPLLYLPSFCSFRMTDIWRSLIAQRCLWEMGFGLVFHEPEVIQERNSHNLMRDFADEIPGYTRNRELVEILEGLTLAKGLEAVCENLLLSYEALIRAEFFPIKEMELVTLWLDDLRKARIAAEV